MRKILLSCILMSAILISACGQAAPQEASAPAQTIGQATIAASRSISATAIAEMTREVATQTPQTAPTAQTVLTSTPGPAVCQGVTMVPQANPAMVALIPPITDSDQTVGPASAGLTIIEYGDFQCPACAVLSATLNQLVQAFPKDVRVVFRQYPLDSHNLAMLAAQASEAAGNQGKFWQMHDLLYTAQDQWSGKTPDDFKTWLKAEAQTLGLAATQFAFDLDSQEVIKKITTERDVISAAGVVTGTPFLFLNNMPYGSSRSDLDTLKGIVALFNMPSRALKCPPMTTDATKQYTATIQTSKGDIVLQLYPDKAPMTVNNFVYMVNQGWYNGSPFYRVLPGFVAQTGDPSGTGMSGPGFQYGLETSPDLKFDKAGMVGMAHAQDVNSNGSQFFITYAAAPNLDGQYTVFAQVTQGMDVVQKLTPRDPSQDNTTLAAPDTIIGITITEK
ncbi:MAG: peptidylprolyl isomerase [Anaerolineaceae bacterium]|nr:peptidylprolyl isomerase [Anaerolineaceae bacterium]